MPNATDIAARFWNQANKGIEEQLREQMFIDDIIAKDHMERLILERLDGVKTVFDGGAGSGRFSLLLAKMGLHVTHFDISLPMIEAAEASAKALGVAENMRFVQGELEDLSAFADASFDMVLSIDAPISYTYPAQASVIKNLLRIAKKRVVFSVASLPGWIPYLFNPAQKAQYIMDEKSEDGFVRHTLDKALPALITFLPDMALVKTVYETHMMTPLEEMQETHEKGAAQWPHTYAFLPEELEKIMAKHGAKNITLSGPGALSRSIPNVVLKNIMADAKTKEAFLAFCYEYDKNIWCAGMGKDTLAACAEK